MSENNLRYIGKSKKDDFGRWIAYTWIATPTLLTAWHETICESRKEARDIVRSWKEKGE